MKIIDLRNAPQHADQLADWYHDQWSYMYPGRGPDYWVRELRRHLGSEFIPTTFLAVDADGLLGSAAIVEQDMESRPELAPWLASVYVAKRARGRGIGSQLVGHAMRSAQDEGIRPLYLFTPDQEAFYDRLGWRTLGKEDYHGEPVTIMEW